MPTLGKCHSARMAAEFVRLGWTLKHEFRADGDDEPYEYVFEWLAEGEHVYPPDWATGWVAFHRPQRQNRIC
jgi:hypothetical protein